LRGKKKLDLFESARIDQEVPIESAMETLKTLVSEGKFDHIGISECSAATLRRAAKVATIAAVEIEISPLSYEEETKKGATVVLLRFYPDIGPSRSDCCGKGAGHRRCRIQPGCSWHPVAKSDQPRRR
jgi:hypothetical protein